MNNSDLDKLKDIAKQIRINIINEVSAAKSGHPGGSLSAAEIVTLLYFDVMNIPSFDNENRDRFVLSKGHASPVLYAALCEKGVFPREELCTFRSVGTRLQGHPDMKKLPGVDMTTGSLGLGISAAVGMALAGKTDNRPYRVYALLGDGEMQEGSVWEALMAAAHYKLDNLTVFVDNNNLQIDGAVSDVMNIYPLEEKMRAFGLNTITVEDGNDLSMLKDAVDKALEYKGAPTVIIAKTVKGKGVSFMENQASWHGTAPNAEQTAQALKELTEA